MARETIHVFGGLTPPTGGTVNDLWRDQDTGLLKRCTGTDTWTSIEGGGATQAFPVGAVFIAVVSTAPATLLGYGTWSAIGAGRVLVGLDSADTDFDLVEETGGAKTHTLAASEMPVHTHTQDAHNHTQDSHNHTQNSHNHTQDAHGHGVTDPTHNHTQNAHSHTVTSVGSAATGGTTNLTGASDTSSTTATAANATATNQAAATSLTVNNATATNQAATATNQAATATNQSATATNQNAGSGGAHNNVQPYLVVYMWKRTA